MYRVHYTRNENPNSKKDSTPWVWVRYPKSARQGFEDKKLIIVWWSSSYGILGTDRTYTILGGVLKGLADNGERGMDSHKT